MGPSQRQGAAMGFLWPITPWSEQSATPGFRPVSYHRARARLLCDLIAGMLSNTCASRQGDAP
jgi:hypothetical protein